MASQADIGNGVCEEFNGRLSFVKFIYLQCLFWFGFGCSRPMTPFNGAFGFCLDLMKQLDVIAKRLRVHMTLFIDFGMRWHTSCSVFASSQYKSNVRHGENAMKRFTHPYCIEY